MDHFYIQWKLLVQLNFDESGTCNVSPNYWIFGGVGGGGGGEGGARTFARIGVSVAYDIIIREMFLTGTSKV